MSSTVFVNQYNSTGQTIWWKIATVPCVKYYLNFTRFLFEIDGNFSRVDSQSSLKFMHNGVDPNTRMGPNYDTTYQYVYETVGLPNASISLKSISLNGDMLTDVYIGLNSWTFASFTIRYTSGIGIVINPVINASCTSTTQIGTQCVPITTSFGPTPASAATNVGIAKTNPQYSLDVGGDLSAQQVVSNTIGFFDTPPIAPMTLIGNSGNNELLINLVGALKRIGLINVNWTQSGRMF